MATAEELLHAAVSRRRDWVLSGAAPVPKALSKAELMAFMRLLRHPSPAKRHAAPEGVESPVGRSRSGALQIVPGPRSRAMTEWASGGHVGPELPFTGLRRLLRLMHTLECESRETRPERWPVEQLLLLREVFDAEADIPDPEVLRSLPVNELHGESLLHRAEIALKRTEPARKDPEGKEEDAAEVADRDDREIRTWMIRLAKRFPNAGWNDDALDLLLWEIPPSDAPELRAEKCPFLRHLLRPSSACGQLVALLQHGCHAMERQYTEPPAEGSGQACLRELETRMTQLRNEALQHMRGHPVWRGDAKAAAELLGPGAHPAQRDQLEPMLGAADLQGWESDDSEDDPFDLFGVRKPTAEPSPPTSIRKAVAAAGAGGGGRGGEPPVPTPPRRRAGPRGPSRASILTLQQRAGRRRQARRAARWLRVIEGVERFIAAQLQSVLLRVSEIAAGEDPTLQPMEDWPPELESPETTSTDQPSPESRTRDDGEGERGGGGEGDGAERRPESFSSGGEDAGEAEEEEEEEEEDGEAGRRELVNGTVHRQGHEEPEDGAVEDRRQGEEDDEEEDEEDEEENGLLPSRPEEQTPSGREVVERVRDRLEGLSFLSLNELDVPAPPSQLTPGWRLAQRALWQVGESISPRDQLQCVANAARALSAALSEAAEAGAALGADEFLPSFIFTLVHADPKELGARVQLMGLLGPPEWLRGEAGYYLTSLISAVAFCLSAGPQEFALDVTPAEWARMQEEARQRGPGSGLPEPSVDEARPDGTAGAEGEGGGGDTSPRLHPSPSPPLLMSGESGEKHESTWSQRARRACRRVRGLLRRGGVLPPELAEHLRHVDGEEEAREDRRHALPFTDWMRRHPRPAGRGDNTLIELLERVAQFAHDMPTEDDKEKDEEDDREEEEG